MSHEEFIELVEAMRAYQRNYFACRDRYNLSRAREYEKQVDRYIQNFKEQKKAEQP